MSKLWYGHFDSTPEDQRELTAEDLATHIRAFVTDGIRNGGTCLQVTADSGMKLKIDAGSAMIQGYVLSLIEDISGRYYPIELEMAHPSLPRIDRVVLRLDRTIAGRMITPVVLMGTAASNPAPRALTRNSNVWELSLAQIRVNAGTLSIASSNITDERLNTSLCGLMNSVLGLDPSVWQAQFDAFLASLRTEETAFLNSHGAKFDTQLQSQQSAWQSQLTAQQTGYAGVMNTYDAWFATVKGDLAKYATFDFDNPYAYPGTSTVTEGLDTNTITETKRNLYNNNAVAVRVTQLNVSGYLAVETLTIYESDGKTVFWRRTAKIADDAKFTETVAEGE